MITAGDLVAPFKRTADPARAYYAVVSKNSAGRPEVADFVNWLREESKKEPR
jgi:DNA-binding transcriptional LysR family regulator